MQCHPDCTHDPADCRIAMTNSYTREPVLQWELVYDGAGNLISQDPNTHVTELTCKTCERSWRTERTADGKERVSEWLTRR